MPASSPPPPPIIRIRTGPYAVTLHSVSLNSGTRCVEPDQLADGVVPVFDALGRPAALGPPLQDHIGDCLFASGDILGRGLHLEEFAGLARGAGTCAGGLGWSRRRNASSTASKR